MIADPPFVNQRVLISSVSGRRGTHTREAFEEQVKFTDSYNPYICLTRDVWCSVRNA